MEVKKSGFLKGHALSSSLAGGMIVANPRYIAESTPFSI